MGTRKTRGGAGGPFSEGGVIKKKTTQLKLGKGQGTVSHESILGKVKEKKRDTNLL